MNYQDFSNLLTDAYYPIAVEILNNLDIREVVNCFHAYEKFRNVSIHVLKRRRNLLGWNFLDVRTLSEDFLKEFHDQFKWMDISKKRFLSESFIREFHDKVVWREICKEQVLSEEFIIEFEDKIDWYSISAIQSLSENFIRRYDDKLDWHNISLYQKLSNGFMCEFRHKIDWIAIRRKHQLDLAIKMMSFNYENLRLRETKKTKRKIEERE